MNHYHQKKNSYKLASLLASCVAISAITTTPVWSIDNNNHHVNRVAENISDEYTFSEYAEVIQGQALEEGFNRALQSPQDILSAYWQNNRNVDRLVDSLRVTRSHISKFGNTHYTLEQYLNGRRVYSSGVKLTLDSTDHVLSMIDHLPKNYGRQTITSAITSSVALQRAIAWNFPSINDQPKLLRSQGNEDLFDQGRFFYDAPTVENIILIKREGILEEGFLVTTWSSNDNLLYETIVDSNGRIVENTLLTAFEDTYRIFNPHPSASPSFIVTGAGNGNASSPLGWLHNSLQRDTYILGNNVIAGTGLNSIGISIGGGTIITNQTFTSIADLSQPPSSSNNQAASVQNLFYHTNLIHDILYQHGFTETAGNFQEDNFGLGGSGSDAVIAMSQDPTGVNNAFFTTPRDGRNPRMRMHLFTNSTPHRASSLDLDIIWHEYVHGLTQRVVGDLRGDVSAAISEGMSDAISIVMTNNDILGEYSKADPFGFRSQPYGGYTRTIGGFDNSIGASIHFNGEIYAATIWELWGIFQNNGLSRDLLMDHLVDSLQFVPPRPDYLDMRDGLLLSTPFNLDCHVWTAFAEFGMGVGAVFGSDGLFIGESFDVPFDCSATTPPGIPPNFSIDTLGAGMNRLSWLPLAHATSYDVFKSSISINGPFQFDGTVTGTVSLEHVEQNTYFKIRGCNAIGCGSFTQPLLASFQACGSIGEPPCE